MALKTLGQCIVDLIKLFICYLVVKVQYLTIFFYGKDNYTGMYVSRNINCVILYLKKTCIFLFSVVEGLFVAENLFQ